MPVRFLCRNVWLIALVMVGEFCLLNGNLRANELACGCRAGACGCVRRSETNGWKVIESKSFRIHHVGASTTAERLAPLCERTRQSLRERWLGETQPTDWSPKCDLFLYPSGAAFQRLTRVPAETWGLADLEVGDKKVWLRRLHLRTDDAQRIDKLLVHELTHVVLADYFAEHQIPRWADEGIAVMSEPIERRNELRRWLTQEAEQRRLFSFRELAAQRHVPRDKRLGDLFYAQSSALIDFLLTEQGLSESQVLRVVSESESRGLSETLARWFPDVTVAALESDWRQWLTRPHIEVQLAEDEPRESRRDTP